MLLEEPELSLHDEVIRHLPQMFAQVQRKGGRQVIVSTHSPRLFTDPGIDLGEILLLRPGPEGSTADLAEEVDVVREPFESGVPLDDALLAATRPEGAEQLALFGR